ncbi:MAG: murein hydrolase activator EnvC family protein [Pseudomonadota bacterium]
MKPLALLLAVSLGICTLSAQAETVQVEDPEALRAQLESLQAEIDKFKAMLEKTRGDRSALEGTLEQNEKEISEILRKIQTIQQDIKQGEDKISSLQGQQRGLESARAEQQALVAHQVRSAFELGNEAYLKVVLNQEDPNELSRMITYYDYFNRARAEQIQAYRETISSIEQVTRELASRNIQLANDRVALDQRNLALTKVRAEKEATLVQLNRAIASTGQEIQLREKDRERLEFLLERITAGIINLPTPGDTVPFAEQKGKLLMPVAGRITSRFGSARNAGKLRWDGVFIEAPTGAPVNAVHYGRVVFSDWLRGFGLLLIINHGDGYMSLYGHNQVLYRETGDWVVAGETIATVGDSGGQSQPGLYFEIRQAGKPADPQLWCRARPASTA